MKTHRSPHLVWCLLAVAILSPGCVKKSLYQKALSDLEAANQQGSMLSKELEACKASVNEASARQKETTERLTASEREVVRLRDLSGTLSTDLGEARRAADEMKLRSAQQEARLKTYRELLERFQSLI